MKAVIICVLAVAAISLARPSNNDTYPSKFDNINLDQILGNRRLLMPYVDCVNGENKKCTAEGRELKAHLGEALETNCAKCTDAQRKGARRVIAHLINNEPQAWNQLKAKYDPSGKYSKKYEAELAKVKG